MTLRPLCRLLLWLCLWLAAPALAVPALWEVSNGKGGELTLFGTIHILPTHVLIGEAPPDPSWFSLRARAAFDAADTLVLEVAPDRSETEAAALCKLAILPAPVPIRTRVPKRLQPKFAAMMEAANLSEAQLSRLKSWAAALALVQVQVLMAGLDPGSGADVSLTGYARSAGKPIIGLETAAFQLQLFNGVPETEQRQMLAAAVQDTEKSAELLNGMIAAWSAGDLDRVKQAMAESEMSADAQKRIFRDRNAAWAVQVARLLESKRRLFMAVGAGHMAGPDSVIPMLEARGLTVRRVQ